MLFIPNNKTRISGIGQGSFGATPSSFLNIGCAIYDVSIGEFITNLGAVQLNFISGLHCAAKYKPEASKNWIQNNRRNIGKYGPRSSREKPEERQRNAQF